MASDGSLPEAEKRSWLLAPIASLVTKRPRLVVVVWLLAMLGLAIAGKNLEDKVASRAVFVSGGAAERAHEMAVREFGGEDTLVVMLRGPRARVDRDGRELVALLQEMPRTLVISPWSSSGTIDGLRPSPRTAAIMVSAGRTEGDGTDVVSAVRSRVDRAVAPPVRVSVAGGPAIVESIRDATADAVEIGERLAIPVLLIVLLLVCRSVLAAALPVVVGGIVVGATRGVLDLLAGAVPVESLALGTAGMFGLALGVDYSLLVVSRFREEVEKGGEIEDAVRRTVLSVGRSILPAGCGLILAMLVSLELIPGSFIASVALSVIASTALSMIAAMLLTPAALVLFGAQLDRWSLPVRRERGSLAVAWSRALSSRPGVVLGMIFVLMLCGAWAGTLKTNSSSVAQLPPDDPGRVQQEEIEGVLGPGWLAPYEIVVDGGDQPITTRSRLDALAAFQRKVERDPGVVAMAGFASLKPATDALGSAQRNLASQRRGMERLNRGLAGAENGAAATVGGFSRAAGGAGELGSAVGQTRAGSGQLADGLQSATGGSVRLNNGLGHASEGSGKLSDATAQASDGAGRLAEKVADARKQTAEAAASSEPLENALRSGEEALDSAPLSGAEEQLTAAWQALQRMSAGRGDPQYAAAVAAVRQANRELTGADPESEGEADPGGVAAGVAHALSQLNLGLYLTARQDKSTSRASAGMEKLAKASARLDRGLRRLERRSGDLSDGLTSLSDGGAQLPPGLRRLTAGAERLLAGLGEVQNGAGTLAAGLDGGAQRSQRLTTGLGRLHDGAEKQGSQSGGLNEQSPGLFKSGYFYLAGLDGGRPEQRRQAGFLVNLSEGGSAGRMLVVGDQPPGAAGAIETGKRLDEDAAELAEETDAEVIVGGFSPSAVELNSALRGQGPLARLVLSLVTLVILIPVTRSLILPILAALFNLLTISATFGLLSLLFNDSLLGGPGYVDTAMIPASIILTFGLAIDYEVFILARVREEYLRTGSTRQAIDNGIAQTAQVVSGAAVIMIAVFIAFSVSPLASFRNFGVGQAIAIFIDAFIIRFVILPAAVRALGDRCWWIPRWLDRIVPGGKPPPPAVGAEA